MSIPIPDWAKDETFHEELDKFSTATIPDFKAECLTRVENYSTFFAEWEIKKDTVLLHLFPRSGSEDKWTDGYYLPRCKYCRSEVPMELAEKRKPCPRCHKVGLIYVPGRQEEKTRARFPRDVLTRVKTATDHVWDGAVAIEPLQELGAVVVQFQDANMGEDILVTMLGAFFDRFDSELEK